MGITKLFSLFHSILLIIKSISFVRKKNEKSGWFRGFLYIVEYLPLYMGHTVDDPLFFSARKTHPFSFMSTPPRIHKYESKYQPLLAVSTLP